MQQAEAQSAGRRAGRGTAAAAGNCRRSRTVSWASAFLGLVFVKARLQLQTAQPCFGKDS